MFRWNEVDQEPHGGSVKGGGVWQGLERRGNQLDQEPQMVDQEPRMVDQNLGVGRSRATVPCPQKKKAAQEKPYGQKGRSRTSTR